MHVFANPVTYDVATYVGISIFFSVQFLQFTNEGILLISSIECFN